MNLNIIEIYKVSLLERKELILLKKGKNKYSSKKWFSIESAQVVKSLYSQAYLFNKQPTETTLTVTVTPVLIFA